MHIIWMWRLAYNVVPVSNSKCQLANNDTGSGYTIVAAVANVGAGVTAAAEAAACRLPPAAVDDDNGGNCFKVIVCIAMQIT